MTDRLQVLCIDDDPELASVTARQLEAQSDRITATAVESVPGARELLEDGGVDCVVADHEMPDTTGLEFLREVRTDRPHLPFILYTGKGNEQIASEAISAGVTDYLQKGGAEGFELLANRVENAVDGRRAERRLAETNRRMERLNRAALDLAQADDRGTAFEATIDAAEDILEFDVCGVYALEDGQFVPKTGRSFRPADGLLSEDEGVIAETYRTGETVVVDDLTDHDQAEPASATFRSLVSVPMGEFGVFQAVSQRPDAFDETDRELAELLVTHATSAIERIDRERDLRETNEQFSTILENTTAIVYIKDLDGRYTLVNSRYEEVLGMDEEEILGKTDHEIQAREYAEQVRANDRKAIAQERPIEVEEEAERGGRVRTYYSVKAPIYDEDGQPAGVCGISSDITELKDRERELEQQKERLDEYASVVSHDLRNPLSVAQGYLELVQSDSEDPRLEDVAEALDRMGEIIEDLRRLAREGNRIGEQTTVEVATVAEEAWSNVESDAAALELETDRTVSADESRLQQVFENLFRNAIEHGVPEGTTATADAGDLPAAGETSGTPAITVRVGDHEGGFFVADDGAGFPDGTIEQAFRPGFSTSDEGTGFGLAISRNVIEAHGWEIGLTESESGGARFEIDI